MNRYEEIGDVLDGYLEELEGLAFDDTTAAQCGAIRAACGHIQRASALLLGLAISEPLRAEVEALEALCACGHDRGDHLVEPPHLCDHEVSFGTAGHAETFHCGCDAFREAGTRPPPEAPPTDVSELGTVQR
jgi:hypothetical protein